MVPQTNSPTGPGGSNSGFPRRGSNVTLWLAVIALLAWQILMVPRLVMDARWLGPQANMRLLPIERLAVSITGTIEHGIHVLIWLFVSLFLGCLLVLAAIRRSRGRGR